MALVDTTVSDSSVGITRISSDNEKGGRVAADALAKLMNEKGSVIVISVKPGVSTTDARIKGFTEEMAKYPGIKVLPTLYDNDLPATAASQIQSTLAAHPDLGGAFAGNTNHVAPELLVRDGLIERPEVPDFPDDYVDYGVVIPWKEDILTSAYSRFRRGGGNPAIAEEFEQFRS